MHPRFVFQVGSQKVLRLVSPDVVEVSQPGTVRFRIEIPPGVVSPGEYSVSAVAMLGAGARDLPRVGSAGPPLKVKVVESGPGTPPRQQSGCPMPRWNVTYLATGIALPVVDRWIAEFLRLQVLSLDGAKIDEIGTPQDMILDATCSFFRPVTRVHAAFVFSSEGRRMLQTAAPNVVAVPEPQTVRFRLHAAAKLLAPGDYSISVLAKLRLDDATKEVKIGPAGLARSLRVCSSSFV